MKTRALGWVGLGVLLMQLGWFITMPPFAGMDEWDHAYRASAVAHGQWVAPPTDATRGTGAMVLVPTDIVEAAHAECVNLPYGGHAECVGTVRGNFTEVASGAGRYNPVYYAMVGWPSRFLDGQVALYGMRLVGLVLCWILIMASLRLLIAWAGMLAGFFLVAGITPAVYYASSTVAPNGLEMVSGMGLWVGLATMVADYGQERPASKQAFALAAVSGALLLSLRSLGPLWAALIVLLTLVAWPQAWPCARSLIRTRHGALLTFLVAIVGGSSVWWVQSQQTLKVGAPIEVPDVTSPVVVALREPVLWTFQMMGTFPYRNNPAPGTMYLSLILVIVVAIALALRFATSRERSALVGCVLASYLFPLAITLMTFEQFGTAWQGRYALPLLVGIPALTGIILGRRRVPRWLMVAIAALVGVAHMIALVNTLRLEHNFYVRSSLPVWPLDIHPAALTVLVAVGTCLLLVPFITHESRRRPS